MIARTSSTRIAQRKRVIPHSTMKNNCNIIQCCNNTHERAPHTGKRMCACASDISDANHLTCDTFNMLTALLKRKASSVSF